MRTPNEKHEDHCKALVAKWKSEVSFTQKELEKDEMTQYSAYRLAASTAQYEGWYIQYLEAAIYLAQKEARMAQDAMGYDLSKLLDILS